jgi:hypothetical protein
MSSGQDKSDQDKSDQNKSDQDKLNTLIKMSKALQKQLREQGELIKELKEENKLIKENTTKMGQHIDFINKAYEKITKSYLFGNIFS